MKEITRRSAAVKLWDPRSVAWWLFVAAVAVGGWIMVTSLAPGFKRFPVTGALAIVLSVPMFVIVWYLVRGMQIVTRPARSAALAAVAWGGVVATGVFAINANGAIILVLAQHVSLDFSNAWGAAIAAPITEETGKLLGVAAVLIAARSWLRGPIDGFLLGAFVGLGFALTENVLYAFNVTVLSFGESQPVATLVIYAVRTLLFWPVSHALFTGLAGAALGFWLGRPGARSALWGALSLAAAYGVHFVWNSPLLPGFLARMAFASVIPFIVWLVIHRARKSESAWVRGVLAAEVADGTLHVIGEGTRDGVGAALAKAVIIGTGGIGQVFRSSTNPVSATGDGIAAGIRAGAAVADMEFVQFHPTVLWEGSGARGQLPLISEAVRGEGAYLLNAVGERFMVGRHELAELAPRDVVSRTIVAQMKEDGSENVFLDCRHLGGEFLRERFPTIWARLEERGIDMGRDLIPVAPAQHFHSGGILTDLNGRSTQQGLYAIGEAACSGVHGANRLASNSLLEGLVFAKRAATDAAALVADGVLTQADPVDRPAPTSLVPATMRRKIQATAHDGAGPIRDMEGLATAVSRLASIRARFHTTDPGAVMPQVAEWETSNVLATASILASAALTRTESRGGHIRSDYPESDGRWKVRLVATLDPDGALQLTEAPLELN